MVTHEKPDAIVVAAGAAADNSRHSGNRGTKCGKALEVLAGRKDVGQKVAVVGGGAIGCETAEYLQRIGKQVTILEMLDDIGKDVSPVEPLGRSRPVE